MQHSDTLKDLLLGAESNAIRLYYQPGRDHVEAYDDVMDEVMDHLTDLTEDELAEGSHRCGLNLDSLEIVGLNVNKFEIANFSLTNWRTLTSLKLESCWGLEQLFTKLRPDKDSQRLPMPSSSGLQLRSFHLRHKYSNLQFRRQLLEFLTTLPGLTTLSVLLENVNQPHSCRELKNVWRAHGKTLRTLVWDERIGPEIAHPEPEDRLPSPSDLSDIAEYCVGLVELGVPCSWGMFCNTCLPWEWVRTSPYGSMSNTIDGNRVGEGLCSL